MEVKVNKCTKKHNHRQYKVGTNIMANFKYEYDTHQIRYILTSFPLLYFCMDNGQQSSRIEPFDLMIKAFNLNFHLDFWF